MREVAGEFERPVLLFSGGKDSIVMLHLARKAFWPAPVPFALMHVDTGHNFPEVIEYRDRVVAEHGLRLVVASVQDAIDDGRVAERADGSRNPLQTVPLLDGITANKFDAVFGGGRRDEEKARAKERVFSLRDEFGQWDPRRQRPELWDLYNGRHKPGEHVRVFPLSNWTELDVWRYIEREQIELPAIYYSHQREVFLRDGMWLAPGGWGGPRAGETLEVRTVRYRTVGDMSCTGAVESDRVDDPRGHRRGRRQPAHRAGRHPRRRPRVRGRHGGPQARGVLLMGAAHRPAGTDRGDAARDRARDAGPPAPGHGRIRRRRQEHPDRPAAVRHEVGAGRPARARSRRRRWPAAAARSTWRCSPTACGPSASRASRSTWRTATSRPPPARSCWPTPRGTCSTRATW